MKTSKAKQITALRAELAWLKLVIRASEKPEKTKRRRTQEIKRELEELGG